jgi:hypothetical protein
MPQKLTEAEKNVINTNSSSEQKAQKQKREYNPEPVTIVRPALTDLKRKIDNHMSKEEVKQLMSDNEEWLRMLISQEPEVDAI